jgi:HD-GYP domain-containing protein (c-di-GMP phosphodiesterase class II)
MIFVPIRTMTLKPEVNLSFDVYVKILDKFVMYLKVGDALEQKRLENLKEKKVRQLFIPAEHEENYQSFLDTALLDKESISKLSDTQKADVVTGYANQAAEEIHKNPESQKSFYKAQKTAKSIIDIVAKNENVLKNLVKNNASDGTESLNELLIRHSVNVATIAARFGETLGLKESDLETFGVAGLFHDIGLTKLDPRALELLFIKDADYTSEDWVLYKKHPETATNIMQDKEYISRDLLTLIFQHEEKKSGGGYPKGINKIAPNQEIFNLCCYYSRRVLCLKIPPADVLQNVMIDEVGNYDLGLLKKFKAFLQKEGLF